MPDEVATLRKTLSLATIKIVTASKQSTMMEKRAFFNLTEVGNVVRAIGYSCDSVFS